MADRTLDQLPEESVAQDADIIYVRRDGIDYKMQRGSVVSGKVSSSRRVNTGPGLKGGRDLQADVTIDLDLSGVLEDTAPNATADYVLTLDSSENEPRRVRLDRLPGGTSGGGGGSNGFANIEVPGESTVSAEAPGDNLSLLAGSNISITTNATDDSITFSAINVVPNSRNVSAGSGLIGGGNLTADRALAVSIATQSEDTAPDLNADFVLTHDSSTGSLRKVRLGLLGGTSLTPIIASPSSLGMIRIGPGLSIDQNGIVSAATSYTLPPATTSSRGGVTVGAGLSVDAAGLLSNTNPTPYVPAVATVGQAGIVKPGSTLTVALDGTLDVVGGTGGGGTVSDGAYRPESYGAIRGVGLSLTQRQANTAALNACLAAAGGAKGRVDAGGGVFEIYGPLSITQSGFVVTGDRCVIRQFQTGVSVVAVSNVSRLTFRGFHLTYQTAQASGDNPTSLETYTAALRLSAVSDSNFEDIETSNAWVGLGVSATTGSFNNTFTHFRLNLAQGLGYGLVHKAGTGSAFINVRVTTANDLPATVSGGVFLAGMGQSHFTQLTIEHLTCSKPLSMVTCDSMTFSGSVFHDLGPVPVGGYGGVIHGSSGTGAQFAGSVVSATRLDGTGLGLADASIYTGELGFSVVATNVWISATTKTGSVRFALLGHVSNAPARNVFGTFQGVRLDTRADRPHRLDDLCYASVDPLSDVVDGPLLAYNNAVGGTTGGYTAYTSDLSIVYPAVHGRYIRIASPLTSEVSLTLSNYIDRPYANSTLNAPRLYPGAVVRVERSSAATGAFLATVNSHDGTAIAPLPAGTVADFVFDGNAWALAGAVIGASSSGGGGGGTFATKGEAEAGASSTTYMSPLRTRDAITAYAGTNEITGDEGQVVSFNASGDAVVVKNTRALIIPVTAETTTLAVGTSLRKVRLPIGLKLSGVEFYLPTSGTTQSIVDVNYNGSSIFPATPSVPPNGTSSSASSFTTGTLAKGGVITIDVDTAGTAAKGLQVTLLGTEV